MTLTEYELERQRRIEENKRRMAALGLTQTLAEVEAARDEWKAARASARAEEAARRAAVKAAAPSPPPAGPRRSSGRLAGLDPECGGLGNDGTAGTFVHDDDLVYGPEEVYTIEHVRALAPPPKSEWTLLQDGYNPDGTRQHDKAAGRTCHQCRQKTLGKRTHCSECGHRVLRGQLCGDCVWVRYGEHIDEVAANPEWKCPCCRDLCNCSFCRTRKGLQPTGILGPVVAGLGFQSVAHYLVLTSLEPAARREALPLMPPDLAEEVRADLEAEEAVEREERENKEKEGENGGDNAVVDTVPEVEVGGKRKAEVMEGGGDAEAAAPEEINA